MVSHQAFRPRHLRKTGFDGEVRHGVTSGVSRETSLNHAFARSRNRPTSMKQVIPEPVAGDVRRNQDKSSNRRTRTELKRRERLPV